MRIDKHDIPVVMAVPGATARQVAAGPELAAEYFSLATGTDIAPLLHGLDGDACQVPHWGYVISGTLVVTFTDGYAGEERCNGGDCFYWPGGHSVRVEDDAEVILFSPHVAHAAVIDHMKAVLQTMA
ncbi:MAG: hypothetical protein R2694_08855 [Ilumatobacteraceae bacterium]